jgi:PAS domain S-box-containing protein
VWPASGVALAAILLCGYRIWPAVALSAFVIAFLSPESYLTALGQGAGSTAAALIGTFLLQRIAKFDNSLSRLRDALALILLGALGSTIVSASIGTLVLHASHIHAYAGLGSAWLIYWLGDSAGVLLVTPLVLTFPNLLRIRNWGRLAELFCLLAILVAICVMVFGDLAIIPVRMIAFAVLPLVIWAAIRFGVSGAAMSIFLVATVAAVQTAIGSGSFASSTPFIDGVQLDVFFAVLSLTGLTFASVYAERELAQREREQSHCEQVAMEVRLQSQELLRHHEERLRLAQQAARIGTFERNLQTGVVTWTPELESMYGLRPGSFGGTMTDFENLVHPEDRTELIVRLGDEAIKTGQPTKGEWRVVWPDGSIHWIAGTWQVFKDESNRPLRVIGVNIDITDRKQAERALHEVNRALEDQTTLLQSREELLKVFVKHVPAAVAMFDRDMRYLQVSDRWCTDYSVDRSEILGRSHYEVFPDMPERWKQIHQRALEGETLRADEDRWDREHGTNWSRWEVRPWKTLDGAVGGILILAEDISRRKQMEEALSGMSRKLLESQEQERARIGRELHDDINQRLAMLALELDQLPENSPELRSRVRELRKELRQISDDVQALSHDLHSSKLEYLGAVAGIRSWCKEFAERQKMEIDFRSDVHSSLPLNIGIPLFRVLQEALHNASKHSGVKRVEVQLREDSDEIHLVVSDSGIGFDVGAAFQGKGLGLSSMQERVRLVNGSVGIESKPMGGTTIHARVPFGSAHVCEPAVGE